MFTGRRARSLLVIGALGAVSLSGCGAGGATHAGAGQASSPSPAVTATTPAPVAGAVVTAQPGAPSGSAMFSRPADVSNRMFPLVPGTQFVYRGKVIEEGASKPHSVVFTVTDLVKVVDGVTTVVAWDRDFLDARLQEQELAFFAQDDSGNVWNFGEYPEEYENGKFAGAPSTWIKGARGTYGGIHMLARPRAGARYSEGLVPAIDFDDVSRVARTGQRTCARSRCFGHVLVIDETSPNDPASGHQIKYYAPATGLIRVGAQGGDSQEFLGLAAVRHLGRAAMAGVRESVLSMDRRAYRVSKVYRITRPAIRRGG
jgi:hypothetical protein